MPDYAFISTFVGVGGLIIAIVTLMSNSKRNHEAVSKRDAETVTKLDFIGSDIKDIKADQHVIQRDLSDVRDIAIQARDRAEAAHKRLDRLHGNEE